MSPSFKTQVPVKPWTAGSSAFIVTDIGWLVAQTSVIVPASYIVPGSTVTETVSVNIVVHALSFLVSHWKTYCPGCKPA